MTDEVGLTQTAGRNQRHIIAIDQQVDEPPSLLFPVAEVMFPGIAIGHKRIVHISFALIIAAKIEQTIQIIKL